MKYRRLGKNGFNISEISFGAWAIGGSCGSVDDETSLKAFVERSLVNLGIESLDLVQLHCPPRAVYDDNKVFDVMNTLESDGKVQHYGVSVETTDEALACMRYPGVSAIQIIFNMFRRKPLDDVFPNAQKNNVGIIARVPLASGLLSGKMSEQTYFDAMSCAIPGAKAPAQARENAQAARLQPISNQDMTHISDIYDRYFRQSIHPHW